MGNLSTKVAFLFTTFLGIGYVPGAPGSYAAALTVLLYYLLAHHARFTNNLIFGLLIIALLIVAIIASDRVSRIENEKDPQFVVIDEVVGQLIALFLIPAKIWNLVLAFFLFRIFDIFKPFPVKRLENLKGGLGIVMDDAAAGLYANLLLQILTRLHES